MTGILDLDREDDGLGSLHDRCFSAVTMLRRLFELGRYSHGINVLRRKEEQRLFTRGTITILFLPPEKFVIREFRYQLLSSEISTGE
jgi:hypothetical protein